MGQRSTSQSGGTRADEHYAQWGHGADEHYVEWGHGADEYYEDSSTTDQILCLHQFGFRPS